MASPFATLTVEMLTPTFSNTRPRRIDMTPPPPDSPPASPSAPRCQAVRSKRPGAEEDPTFWASGISLVAHLRSPLVPAVHMNTRHIVTSKAWFGGGADLNPMYPDDADTADFHAAFRAACERHDPDYYPRFKAWCDEYFFIKHRGETRGLGGIFFDDQNDKEPDQHFEFSKACANAVVPAYLPIVEKRKDSKFTQKEKEWQLMRRGRYVEFNLVYDRGTTFGLRTGGRIESILMSLPLTARWQYDMQPEEGSREADALDAFRNPRTWVA